MGGGWVLDLTKLMLFTTQVEVVVEVGVELGKKKIMKILTLIRRGGQMAHRVLKAFYLGKQRSD